MKKRTQSRALPWFGADTQVAAQYAALLADCRHVTVPFCGGLSVVAHLVETAGEVVCNDLHNHAINFYRVISSSVMRADLIAKLTATPFHAQVLLDCQECCKLAGPITPGSVDLAYNYFVTAWMGRSSQAGTDREFNGSLAMRWDAGGGSSPLRFQTAVRSIAEVWGPICERCSFVCMDWSDVLAKVKDAPSCGVYLDPPWVGAGDEYKHKFSAVDHNKLASALHKFDHTKIVLRYDDTSLVRCLYQPQNGWRVREIKSRDQANGGVSELCITNFAQGDR